MLLFLTFVPHSQLPFHSHSYTQLCFFPLSHPPLQSLPSLSRFPLTSSLVFPHITSSSADVMFHRDSRLTSSVSRSFNIAIKKDSGDPRCNPTFTSNHPIMPTAHLTAVRLFSYISCTTLTYSSNCDFQFMPQFITRHSILGLFQVHEHTVQLTLWTSQSSFSEQLLSLLQSYHPLAPCVSFTNMSILVSSNHHFFGPWDTNYQLIHLFPKFFFFFVAPNL